MAKRPAKRAERPPKRERVAEPVAVGPSDPSVETRVEVRAGRLQVVKTFPPGRIQRPPGPDRAVVIRPLACPYCGAPRDQIEETSHKGNTRYFRCGRCVDPETCEGTAFKVLTVEV